MAFHHIPVLFNEVMDYLSPSPGETYADGTLGGGGHSEGILRLSGGSATLYGIDRDMDAIRAAGERLKQYPGFHAIHGNFHDAKALLNQAGARGEMQPAEKGEAAAQISRYERYRNQKKKYREI